MNDNLLISLVQSNEELYNLHHPSYTNHLRRDNIWEEIGDQLGEGGIQCRERWQRIRENFRKALNLRKTKRCQGAEKIKPPKFYNQLRFLLPYLSEEEDRRCIISKRAGSASNLDMRSQSPVDSPDGESQFSDSSLSNTTKYVSPNPAAKRRCTQLPSSDQPTITPTPQNDCTGVTEVSLPTDPDPLIDFFLTMARTVKTFPLSKQLDIKGQLFQMVHNVEIELMNTEYASKSTADRSFEMVTVTADEGAAQTEFKVEPPTY